MSWYPPAPKRRPGSGPWRAAGKRPFGATWWGKAWVDALEQRARLDPNRLPRGRTYARTGAVGELGVRAGEIVAAVQGSRAKPYRVTVRVRTYSEKEWDRTLTTLASRVGHLAALLDGEMPPAVIDDLAAAKIDLLPVAGEVQPRCSCPDWADPCKHSAAVCYLVADTLDADPFLLFLMRGRDRETLLAGLRARRAAGVAGTADSGGRGTQDRGASRMVLVPSKRLLGAPTPVLAPSRRGRVGQRCRPLAFRRCQLSPYRRRSMGGRRCWRWIRRPAPASLQLRSYGWRATQPGGPGEMAHGERNTGLELPMAADLARRAAATLGPPAGQGGIPQAGIVGRRAGP